MKPGAVPPWIGLVDDLAAAYTRLPREGRTAFLRAVSEQLPVKFLLGAECRRLRRGRLDYERAEIQLSLSSDAELIRLRSCAKEPWTVSWIEQSIGPDSVLYDIGSNVGAYALVAAKVASGQGRIIAFEPGYANFAALCENIVLNGEEATIIPLPFALADRTRLGRFNYRDIRAGAAVHLLSDAGERLRFTPEYTQPVVTYRLDDVVEQFHLPPPTHVKVDVDGTELAVLAGAERTLTQPAARSLMIEVGKCEMEVVALLRRYGFELRQKFEKRNSEGSVMSTWYGLFER